MIITKEKNMYCILKTIKCHNIIYRESSYYPPIHIILESSVANTVTNNGNATFMLNQQIQIPNNVVECFFTRIDKS